MLIDLTVVGLDDIIEMMENHNILSGKVMQAELLLVQ